MAADPKLITIANNGTSNSLYYTFSKSADDDGSGGDAYSIRWSVNSNMSSPTTQADYINATGASSYTGTTPTTLSALTQYYFQVRFKDSSTRTNSNWVDTAGEDYATTSAGGPDAPGPPTGSSVTFEEIGLTWPAVSGATGYKLYWGEGTGDPSGNETSVVAGSPPTRIIDGLDEAQNYSFRVKTVDSGTDSDFGPTYTQSTKWEDEATIFVNNGVGNDYESNTITWTVPTSDAGGDSSQLYGEINDTSPDNLISTQSGTGAKTYHHASLTSGGTYSYQLRIFLANHNDFYSTNQVVTVTNAAEPVITNVSFSNIGDTTATVTWTDNNALSFKYLVTTTSYSNSTYNFSQHMSTTGVNTNSNTANLTGLTENTAYKFYINPYQYTNNGFPIGDTYGFGNDPPGYQTFTTSAETPDAPGTISITAKTDTTINTSWSAVSGATGYKLYYGTSSNPTSPGTTQSGTTKNFTSLTAATTYYIRIKAYNAGGDSGYSPQTTADTATVDPSIPVAASNSDPTEQVITWPTPAGTHTSYLYGTGNNSTTQLAAIAVGNTETYTQATTPGSTYYYRTRTVTTNHNSLYSDYSAQLTATAASVTPQTSITYIALSTSTVLLLWSNPTYSDRMYLYTTAGYAVTVPDYETGTSRTFGDGDKVLGSTIALGQNDGFALKLKNYYDGHYSAYSSDFNVYTNPGPVTSFAASDLSDTEINLTWAEPTMGADGLTQYYLIKFRIDNTGSWTTITSTATGTSYTHTGLTQGTAYYYQIYTSTGALGPSGGLSTVETANDTTQTGPDPVAGDALGLGALGHATGVNGNATSQTSFSACNGGNTSEISFRDFYAGSVGTLTGASAVLYNNSTTITANFSNKGTLFNSRIGSVAGNFTWTRSNTNISIANASDYTAVITAEVGGNSTSVLTMTYAGRYNTHSSIPNQSRNKTITCVGGGP
jgi:hypothetical protein